MAAQLDRVKQEARRSTLCLQQAFISVYTLL